MAKSDGFDERPVVADCFRNRVIDGGVAVAAGDDGWPSVRSLRSWPNDWSPPAIGHRFRRPKWPTVCLPVM